VNYRSMLLSGGLDFLQLISTQRGCASRTNQDESVEPALRPIGANALTSSSSIPRICSEHETEGEPLRVFQPAMIGPGIIEMKQTPLPFKIQAKSKRQPYFRIF